MANTKSAAKRARQITRRTAVNQRSLTAVKNQLKGARSAIKGGKKDEVKAAVSASPAWPFCAIGWPSNVVATDHGSPGMLNRIEVIAPPNSAPQ